MKTHWFFYVPSTATATAKSPDALESALRTLAHALLRLAAKRALRHQAQARRQRVLHARAARCRNSSALRWRVIWGFGRAKHLAARLRPAAMA